MQENLGHIPEAALGVKVVDGRPAHADGLTRVEGVRHAHHAGIKGIGCGEGLEGGPKLEHTGGDAVHAVLVQRRARVVGIVVRQRDHCENLACMGMHDNAHGSLGAIGFHCLLQLGGNGVLHADVKGERHGLELRIDGKAHAHEVSQPGTVKVLLHSGNAAVVHIHVAQDMGRERTAGIDAATLVAEAYARQAKIVDRLALARGEFTGNPYKGAP